MREEGCEPHREKASATQTAKCLTSGVRTTKCHRIKKNIRASQCFKRFYAAGRTLEGIEAVNMMRKRQVKRLAGGDAQEQAKFVASLFSIAA